ncbi:MAG TPA: M23 family metallopeptidase [Oligoflexia bacterium]|nr:M23 family metallopeptidase [Oligoflexia bacterium]HMP47714.1 M23 family metallopeptidase [Oligoflexia bacterium]
MRSILSSLLIASLMFMTACSIGGFGARKQVPAKPVYHTIKKGESLLGISGRYLSTPDEILLLNGMQTTRYLRVGQRLLVGYQYEDEIKTGIMRASIRSGSTSNQLPSSSESEFVGGSRSGDYVYLEGGKIAWPLLEKARIVSGFGPRRSSFHDGLDVAAPVGTTIVSVHNGIVAYSGSDLGGYGNLIVIKGDDGLISVYAHNRKNFVSKGSRVSKGQKIAEVGSTGRAEGPHLHFEVRAKDTRGRAVAIDPMPLLKPEYEQKPRFRVNESLKPILAWLDGKSDKTVASGK